MHQVRVQLILFSSAGTNYVCTCERSWNRLSSWSSFTPTLRVPFRDRALDDDHELLTSCEDSNNNDKEVQRSYEGSVKEFNRALYVPRLKVGWECVSYLQQYTWSRIYFIYTLRS